MEVAAVEYASAYAFVCTTLMAMPLLLHAPMRLLMISSMRVVKRSMMHMVVFCGCLCLCLTHRDDHVFAYAYADAHAYAYGVARASVCVLPTTLRRMLLLNMCAVVMC